MIVEVPKQAWDFVEEVKPIFRHLKAKERSMYIFAHAVALLAEVSFVYDAGRVIYASSERKSGYYSLEDFKKALKDAAIAGGRINLRDEGVIREELEKLRIFFGLETREEAVQMSFLVTCELGTIIKEYGMLYHGIKGSIYSEENLFLPEFLEYIRKSILH